MNNDNNIDFKDLWKKQTINQPNMEDLLSRLKQFKKANLRTLWRTNILLFCTSTFILFVWYYYQPQFISSKIGIVLTIVAMAMYVLVYNGSLKDFKAIDATQTNHDYLQRLIAIKKKQQFMQSTILTWYFIILLFGICLYMYEYLAQMTVFYAFVTYGITLLWIAFNWFYIRPKQIKKQEAKINNLIERFEEMDRQLGES